MGCWNNGILDEQVAKNVFGVLRLGSGRTAGFDCLLLCFSVHAEALEAFLSLFQQR